METLGRRSEGGYRTGEASGVTQEEQKRHLTEGGREAQTMVPPNEQLQEPSAFFSGGVFFIRRSFLRASCMIAKQMGGGGLSFIHISVHSRQQKALEDITE